MSIKPILFNTDMVRAIIDGRKTVTRRVVDIDISNQFDVEPDRKTVIAYIDQETGDSYDPAKICRYQPEDILYVRETFKRNMDGYSGIDFGGYIYKADCKSNFKDNYNPWKPSIHMPKEAARIFLKVKDVRVERLNDMKPEDVRKEGMHLIFTPKECKSQFDKLGAIYYYEEARRKFSKLWNSTIKKSDIERYGWDANPWVWVIEFERCEKPELLEDK